jgi:hypothetical protein
LCIRRAIAQSLGRRALAGIGRRATPSPGGTPLQVGDSAGVPLSPIRRFHAAARAPALVVYDRADREVDFSNGEALAWAWPGARMHATSGLGHRRILRTPAAVADIVAFVVERLPRCACGRLAVGAGRGAPRCLSCVLADDLWARERRRDRRQAGGGAPSASLRTGP